jgi:hypothetical protein
MEIIAFDWPTMLTGLGDDIEIVSHFYTVHIFMFMGGDGGTIYAVCWM